MKKNTAFDAAELASSPMVHVGMKLPRLLLDKIDEAAIKDDESCRNRSSVMRRALVQFLRRDAA